MSKRRKTGSAPKKPRPRPILFEELEPRLLLSADVSPLVVDALIDEQDAAVALAEQVAAVEAAPAAAAVASDADVRRLELVFVDTGVEDYQALIDDILANGDDGRVVDVVLLDSGRDGIAQISETLADYRDLDAVHLISHGADGEVALGDGALNFDSLLGNAGAIKAWGDALAVDADLLIYGCDLAASADGRSLVDALGRLTGADVAASDDLTGAAALGGDWDLEYRTGAIEADVALSLAVQADWAYTLAITTNSTSSAQTSGAQPDLTWAHTVASGGNRLLTVSISMDSGQSTGVTYGGASLTLVDRFTGGHVVEIWQLTAPLEGTANIVATFSGSLQANGGAVAFNGVDQAAPTGTLQGLSGTGTTASIDITSDAGDIVLDTVIVDVASSPAFGLNQTQQWIEPNGGMDRVSAGSTEAGGGTVTMSWGGMADDWTIAAVTVKPAAPSATLWLSTDSNVAAPGADGLAAWTQAEVVVLLGMGLAQG
ncbi:MAG: DUF4347 domain-containing protein, partial [Gammaproteobacteria bacterium]|nr:DUF4347 domain-containing protein [Gammaproteobacteria bacterium]